MKKQFIVAGLLTIVLFSLSATSLAQGGKKRKGEPAKSISDAEKATVLDIFRTTLDVAQYYLEFERGAEVYGTSTFLTADQLTAIRNKRTPAGTENFVIGSYYNEMGMVFIVRTRASVALADVFGRTNATKLEAIINKYTGGK